MGEEFEINMFGEVSHISRSQALSPISRRSVRRTKIVVTKRPCDEMTGYRQADGPGEGGAVARGLTLYCRESVDY